MKVELDGKEIVIRIPVQEPKLSGSGKNLTVATSGGNQATGVLIKGKPVIVGVNCYIRN